MPRLNVIWITTLLLMVMGSILWSPPCARAQDTTPPSVDFIYPLRIGDLIHGTVLLQANATDNVGVVGVQFQLDDGTPLGPDVTSPPWQMSWDSTALAPGAYLIRAKAWDAAGNWKRNLVGGYIIVYRDDDITPPTLSNIVTAGLTSRSVQITWTTNEYANSSVDYGLTDSYGSTNPVHVTEMDVVTHSTSLTGLSPSTTYHYRVRSTDPAGNESVSGDHTFTTPADPAFPSGAGWTDLGSLMQPVCTPNNDLYYFYSNCKTITDAWGGGVWDSTGKRLIMFGGGHQNYAGNGVYAFNTHSLGFERIQEDSGGFIYQPGTCEDALPDRNPVSRHTYNNITYLPALNAMWLYGGSRACGSGGFGTDTWLFDLATRQWTELAVTGTTPGAALLTSAYDAQTNQIYVTAGGDNPGLYTYNVGAQVWTKRNSFSFGNYLRLVSEIDPVRRVLVIIGGEETTHTAVTCSLDSYTCQNITTTGDADIEYDRSPGLAYDPVRTTIVAWDGGSAFTADASSVYELDLGTNVWTKTTGTGGPSVATNGSGTFGRWQYIPDWQGFLAISTATADAYLWRFGAQGPTQTPGIAPTPSATPASTATPTLGAMGSPPPTATPPPTAAGTPVALSIPLTIQELLPADDTGGIAPTDVVGYTRNSEPVTFGVPLKDSDAISSTSQLAIARTGTPTAAQFRVLKQYPSGNIQWVLVDTLANVPANGADTGLALTAGTNPASGTLATDDGTTITVTTGVATFTIRKANSNFINSAVVGGTTVIAGGHSGGVEYTDPSGALYSSVNDAASTATIEENGPLKATILLRGRLRLSDGATTAMGFSARLSFYKDQHFVRGRVSIENAFRDDLTRKALHNIQVRLPSVISTGAFDVATKTGTVTGTLSGGQGVYLYHGQTTHKDAASVNIIRAPGANAALYAGENDYNWGMTGLTKPSNDLGYTIVQTPSTVLTAFGGSADYSRGFAELRSGTSAAVDVAMRDLDSFYPAGIELDATGNAAVQWFSPHNAKPINFDWGVHETRDIVWDFTAGVGNPLLTHYRAQYPLMGRAPYEQYRVTGALLGRTHLVDLNEMQQYHANNIIAGHNQFASANAGEYSVSNYLLPNQPIIRFRSFTWGDGGRQTNNDQTFSKVLAYLQTGNGGFWWNAYNIMGLVIDQAIHRSDREDRATWPSQLEQTIPGCASSSDPLSSDLVNGCASQFEEDMEHENTLGVVPMYYLTGDEFIREALIDHAEWFAADHPNPTGLCVPGTRGDAQRLKWYALIWEMTADSWWKTKLDQFVANRVCATLPHPVVDESPEVFAHEGESQDRGYVWRVQGNVPGPQGQRYMSIGPTSYIPQEAEWEAIRVLPDSDPNKERLQDQLVGQAYALLKEAYFDRSGSDCRGFGDEAGGIYSAISLDAPPPDDALRRHITEYNLLPALTTGLQLMGDPAFAYIGRRTVGAFGADLTCGNVLSIGQMYHVYDLWSAQEFIYLDNRASSFGTVFLNDDSVTYGGLTVVENPAGTYTVRWTVPSGAQRYQIKYGPQPMVPNLNFDRMARTYQYDPTVYDNFWATNGQAVTNQPTNVTDEPAPATPGTVQTYVKSGLPSGLHWALRVETNGSRNTTAGRPIAPKLL